MRTLFRLLRFLKPHAGWAAVAVGGMAGVAVTTVFLVFLIYPVFDELLGAGAGAAVLGGRAVSVGDSAPRKVPDTAMVHTLRARFEGAKHALAQVIPSESTAIVIIAFLTVLLRASLTYFGHYALYRTGLATI